MTPNGPSPTGHVDPSTTQRARRLDPLVALLLPTVIHRLGNATQLISGLNSMLGFGDSESLNMVAGRAGDLTRAGEKATRVGYALAVLGSAQGSEMLMVRREPSGLEWMLDFLAEGLRRTGLELQPGPLPQLASGAADGWQPPWVVARVLLAAAHGPAGAGDWSLQAADDGWHLRAGEPEPEAWKALSFDLREQAPSVRLQDGPGAHCVLPMDWFRA